jgi:hypothetical protein
MQTESGIVLGNLTTLCLPHTSSHGLGVDTSEEHMHIVCDAVRRWCHDESTRELIIRPSSFANNFTDQMKLLCAYHDNERLKSVLVQQCLDDLTEGKKLFKPVVPPQRFDA